MNDYLNIKGIIPGGKMILASALLLIPLLTYSQADKKYIRQGNREFEKNKFSESEISYRRAIDKNKESDDAVFNAGDALYKQEKYEDAGRQFVQNHDMTDDKIKRSSSLYNLGNSMLMANKIKESIDAYKGSLKLNPGNMEAKYNLAYAQDLLKEQEQQEQQNQQNQDQDKNQQEKDNNQQNKNNQDNKDQQQQQQQQQKDQQQQQQISKEDAERLLNALANDEKNIQEKVKLAKAAKARTGTLKNW